ncbi:MAG: membrane protein insertase YidC [Lachnospiraceae bacterium]|nr:membrane protein insertase YidC [Lachnospiraceae bacterium]
MLNIILTQNNTPIIGWCAKLLGKVMEWLYLFFQKGLSIENIGLCIIVFTLIVKLLMIPLTVKQQKFTKLSTLMNPELQEIQKKYKNKRDNESMIKMNEETQAVYEKYGTSPTGSCLQLLIQMPIMFSLYYIVSSVPAYVPQVYSYYEPVSKAVVADYDYYKYLDTAYDKYVLEKDAKDEYEYIDDMLESFKNASNSEKKVIDNLAKYSTGQWDNLIASYENVDKMVEELSAVTDKEWDEMVDGIEDKDEKEDLEEFIKAIKAKDISEYIDSSKVDDIKKSEDKVMEINEFGPINLSQSPSAMMGIALLIPFLSFFTQWLSVQISMRENKNNNAMQDNPMGSSIKVMNIMLPLMSAFIAYTVPSGLGLYWVCTGVFQIITQVCISAYFKKVDVQDIIAKNVEKMNKKKEKYGIDSSMVASAASTNTKNIQKKTNVSNKSNTNASDNKKYKAGSMAAKANMVREYNEKNRK